MATKIEGHVRTHLLKERQEFVESALWTKHKCGGDGYDTPATLIIGGKGFTHDEVKAILVEIQRAMARDMIHVSEGRLPSEPPAIEIENIAARHGIQLP